MFGPSLLLSSYASKTTLFKFPLHTRFILTLTMPMATMRDERVGFVEIRDGSKARILTSFFAQSQPIIYNLFSVE
jgi:hypothetical protein